MCSAVENNTMIDIFDSMDIEPFARKVVAFKSDSVFYKSVALDSAKSVRFGVVSLDDFKWQPTDEVGFNLNQLIKSKEVGSVCPLVHGTLSVAPISVRLATPLEIRAIRDAITNNDAKFANVSDSKIVAKYLSDQLPNL